MISTYPITHQIRLRRDDGFVTSDGRVWARTKEILDIYETATGERRGRVIGNEIVELRAKQYQLKGFHAQPTHTIKSQIKPKNVPPFYAKFIK